MQKRHLLFIVLFLGYCSVANAQFKMRPGKKSSPKTTQVDKKTELKDKAVDAAYEVAEEEVEKRKDALDGKKPDVLLETADKVIENRKEGGKTDLEGVKSEAKDVIIGKIRNSDVSTTTEDTYDGEEEDYPTGSSTTTEDTYDDEEEDYPIDASTTTEEDDGILIHAKKRINNKTTAIKDKMIGAVSGVVDNAVKKMRIALGAKAGVLLSTVAGDVSGYEERVVLGYEGGLLAELQFGKRFSLQTEILYRNQGFILEAPGQRHINRITVVRIPILAKVRFELGERLALNIQAGPQFGTQLTKRIRSEFGDLTYSEKTSYGFEGNPSEITEIGAAVGGGMEITMGPGKFIIDLRCSQRIKGSEDNVPTLVFGTSFGYLYTFGNSNK